MPPDICSSLHREVSIVSEESITTYLVPARKALLLLSYMRQKHGRIIQVSYDEEEILILQYSQLCCFKDVYGADETIHLLQHRLTSWAGETTN